MKNIKTMILVLATLTSLPVWGKPNMEKYTNEIHQIMEIDKMPERLKPNVIRTKTEVNDIAGINIPNTVAILNSKGEIALLKFDDDFNTTEEVPVPGFPGAWGKLETDPEHKLTWLRRGSGNYFLDPETKKTGHCVSKFPGSKVYQVILAEPENRKWMIVYGQMGGRKIDSYSLIDDSKKYLGLISGRLWAYSNNRVLANTTSISEEGDWRFTDSKISYPTEPKEHELTKKMTNLGVDLVNDSKPYNLKSRTMIGYVNASALINGKRFPKFSIRWNEEEDEVKIEPFTTLQQPKDIAECGHVNEFSPDGKWYDSKAIHNFNGISEPDERFIYHIGDQYPIGISPPIRLGLVDYYTNGAFMMHDTHGPCYILLDEEESKNLIIYKLNEGKEIIAKQLMEYVPEV